MTRSLNAHNLATLFHLRIILVVIVALLGLTAVLIPSVSAQEQELQNVEKSVEIDFPESITFNLSFDAPAQVERVELRYEPVHAEIGRAERPAFQPGRSVDISYDLDTRIQYFAPGIDIEYRWIVTLENGQVLETETESFFYNDNRYDWQEHTVGNVSIYYYTGGTGFGETAMDVTLRTIEQFGTDFTVDLDQPINIMLYGSSSDFQQALPYNSPEWIGGFANPDMNLIVAGIAPGDRAATEMGRMLTHEVVHLLVAQATANPFNGPPRWLDEGLAIVYQEIQDQRFDRVLQQAIDAGRLIPVRALRSSFPSDPDLAILSYAQSESIVTYLIEEHGHDAVADLLAIYRQGVSHNEAVERTLGMNLDELDASWKSWLGYDGDRAEGPGTGPLTPDTTARVEDALVTLGITPFLVVGGAVVIILGIVKIVRSVNTRDLDEDVPPEVEYYGQDMFDDDLTEESSEYGPESSSPFDRA